jgi:hypothetical protein
MCRGAIAHHPDTGQRGGGHPPDPRSQISPDLGFLSLENDLGYAYENQALSAQVALNSVLGLGEQLYAQATTGPDIGTLFNGAPRRRVLGLGAIFALGDNGLTFNPEYTVVDTNPRVPQGGVQVTGHFERLSFRAAYPLIRTRRERLGLSASFDLLAETEEAKAFGLTLNHDRLRMANIGLNWSRSLAASTVIATDAQFTQGIAGLGARKLSDVIATNVPFTRQGAKPDFSKLGGHWRSDTQLGEGFSLTTIARGQASLSGVLPAPAQFSLDGSDALSSFSQGSVNADSGVTGRAELARAMPYGRQNRSLITPTPLARWAMAMSATRRCWRRRTSTHGPLAAACACWWRPMTQALPVSAWSKSAMATARRCRRTPRGSRSASRFGIEGAADAAFHKAHTWCQQQRPGPAGHDDRQPGPGAGVATGGRHGRFGAGADRRTHGRHPVDQPVERQGHHQLAKLRCRRRAWRNLQPA